jgi:hypothetical protein
MIAPATGIGPVVPASLMPSGKGYDIGPDGQINASPLDVGILLGLGFSSSNPASLAALALAASGNSSQVLYGDGIFNTPGGGGLPAGGSVGQVVTNTAPGTGGWANRGPYPFFGNRGGSTPWSRPSLAAFSTWVNQTDSGNTATATDGSNGFPLVIRAGLDATNYCTTALLKTPPTPPWTIDVALAAFTNCVTSNNGPGWLPFVLKSTAGKIVELFWYTVSPSPSVVCYGFNDSSISTTAPTQLDDGLGVFPFSDYLVWFRAVHDGAAISFYVSPEGVIFEPITLTTPVLSFLSDVQSIGFGYNRFNTNVSGTNKAANVILWNWVETSP